MRYLVLSDIHGGSAELERALNYFDQYQCDYIVLLGDLLNHGPRNRVPDSYQPPKVAEMLNAYSTKIISVRGNCDSEVDSMMFNFPCNAPYGYIIVSQPDEVAAASAAAPQTRNREKAFRGRSRANDSQTPPHTSSMTPATMAAMPPIARRL